MNLQTEKLKLIELLKNTQNANVINRIKDIFEMEQKITNEYLSKEEIEVLDIAMIQMQNNQTINFNQFIAKFK